MRGAFVLDTSIALRWFLADEADRDYSLAVLSLISDRQHPVVPWLWYYEVVSTLLVQVRRKRVDFVQMLAYLEILKDMYIEVDSPQVDVIFRLPQLAFDYQLTGYDAAFLELAKRRGIPLATADKALLRAAPNFGVDVLRVTT